MATSKELNETYTVFYDRLRVLRHDFHRIGRFDDANAKLDELCKLFVLKYVSQQFPSPCGRSRLSKDYLTELAASQLGNPTNLAGALHLVFDEMQKRDAHSLSLFGKNARLDIDPSDDEFALSLLPVIEALPLAQQDGQWSFDLLNEAFGHFVQDSFRHRKEDAQYLTPPEVVASMVDIGIHDLLKDHAQSDLSRRFIVADPTCGVASFLAATFCHASAQSYDGRPLVRALDFLGQDKVERMVRLAKVNMQLFTDTTASIRLGNSVSGDSLDDMNGQVDLVLTNPPFGASFERDQLFEGSGKAKTANGKTNTVDPVQFPILSVLSQQRALPSRIDSEFLILDRSVALLRDAADGEIGGRALIVVPDKVVAADGFAADFRRAANEIVTLRAVIDLPAEAFAQAGTRTKTSIVYLHRNRLSPATTTVFMASVDDLGFRVASRAGVTVKKQQGDNQLSQVTDLYKSAAKEIGNGHLRALSQSASAVSIHCSELIHGRWNASFYRPQRVQALTKLEQLPPDQFDVRQLVDLVNIDPDHNVRVGSEDDAAIISVLHVSEDGFIDIGAVESYAPTSPSVRCQANDVLISRINPRIVRICVVPDFGRPVACSPEFAVLRCNEPVDPWLMALTLRSQLVQDQIQTLTSGTSSSHNRIKVRELATVLVPWPRTTHESAVQSTESAITYRDTLDAYYRSVRKAIECFRNVSQTIEIEKANPKPKDL